MYKKPSEFTVVKYSEHREPLASLGFKCVIVWWTSDYYENNYLAQYAFTAMIISSTAEAMLQANEACWPANRSLSAYAGWPCAGYSVWVGLGCAAPEDLWQLEHTYYTLYCNQYTCNEFQAMVNTCIVCSTWYDNICMLLGLSQR